MNQNPSQSYRDLKIHKVAHQLAVEIHALSMKLPKFELYEVGSQIRRSSKSVSANIVEGFCRKKYQAEYVRFLIFAHGSCNETIEHLEILFETGSMSDKEGFKSLKLRYEELGRMLNGFIRFLSNS